MPFTYVLFACVILDIAALYNNALVSSAASGFLYALTLAVGATWVFVAFMTTTPDYHDFSRRSTVGWMLVLSSAVLLWTGAGVNFGSVDPYASLISEVIDRIGSNGVWFLGLAGAVFGFGALEHGSGAGT